MLKRVAAHTRLAKTMLLYSNFNRLPQCTVDRGAYVMHVVE